MKTHFPSTKIGKAYLGQIYRPYAEVEISSDEIGKWIPIEAVVDTGADYTLLPRRYAFLLGIDLTPTVCRKRLWALAEARQFISTKRVLKLD